MLQWNEWSVTTQIFAAPKGSFLWPSGCDQFSSTVPPHFWTAGVTPAVRVERWTRTGPYKDGANLRRNGDLGRLWWILGACLCGQCIRDSRTTFQKWSCLVARNCPGCLDLPFKKAGLVPGLLPHWRSKESCRPQVETITYHDLINWHYCKTPNLGFFNRKSDGLLPDSIRFHQIPKLKSPRRWWWILGGHQKMMVQRVRGSISSIFAFG